MSVAGIIKEGGVIKRGWGACLKVVGCMSEDGGYDKDMAAYLNRICLVLGCAGDNPAMCLTGQDNCAIIRKVIRCRPKIVECSVWQDGPNNTLWQVARGDFSLGTVPGESGLQCLMRGRYSKGGVLT